MGYKMLEVGCPVCSTEKTMVPMQVFLFYGGIRYDNMTHESLPRTEKLSEYKCPVCGYAEMHDGMYMEKVEESEEDNTQRGKS